MAKALKVNWSPQTFEELCDQWILPMLFLVSDEDLKRIERDFPNWEDQSKVLLIMAVEPKEKWRELGVPEYMMKYEIYREDEEEEWEEEWEEE